MNPPESANVATPQQPRPPPNIAQTGSQANAVTSLPPPPSKPTEPASRKRRSRWDAIEETPQAEPTPATSDLLPTPAAAPRELPGEKVYRGELSVLLVYGCNMQDRVFHNIKCSLT